MSHIKTTLAKYKLRAKKRLGQNFLKHRQSLQIIADHLQITENDHLLEIGAGIGNLSVFIAKGAKKFYALEKDPAYEQILKDTLGKFKNAEIIIKDILKFDISSIFKGERLKITGNLPFYITSPILNHLLNHKEHINSILITVQHEVAQRIIAQPGTKDYGRLSCLLQFYTKPTLLEIFPRELFYPKPNVDSALVDLKILDKPLIKVASEKVFFAVVKTIFSHRRKTLLNSLLTGDLGIKKEKLIEILGQVNISGAIRGEQLSLAEIGKFADAICVYKKAY